MSKKGILTKVEHRYKTVSTYIRSNPEAKPTEVICPTCRERRIENLYWTGNGTPRIYCPKCIYDATHSKRHINST